jgi:hypothetical protein
MLNLRIALTGTEIGMTRTGLLALAVTFSAGIHAALVPEHLNEMPPLGYAFIAAALIGGLIACALVSRPDDRRLPLLVPGFSGTPESIETIALAPGHTRVRERHPLTSRPLHGNVKRREPHASPPPVALPFH